jgi:hypothetical protein
MSDPLDDFNTQEYLHSVLADSSVAEEAAVNVDGLFNRRDPNTSITHEKPEHRLAIMLKAKHGLSNREIARALNYTDAHISQLFRQPWAQQEVLKQLKTGGGDGVLELIESEAANNVFTAIEIRDNPQAPSVVRLAAANSLLDRFLGKPTQHIESDTTVHQSKDIAEVDRELAALQAEERRLCGESKNN